MGLKARLRTLIALIIGVFSLWCLVMCGFTGASHQKTDHHAATIANDRAFVDSINVLLVQSSARRVGSTSRKLAVAAVEHIMASGKAVTVVERGEA